MNINPIIPTPQQRAKGLRNRWARYSPQERKEWGQFLARARQKAKELREKELKARKAQARELLNVRAELERLKRPLTS